MAQQDLEKFWKECEDQLQQYTTEFNTSMGLKGLKVEYKIIEKTPIGIIYFLLMHHNQLSVNRGDVLLISMHISQEIVNNIKELLQEIQQ